MAFSDFEIFFIETDSKLSVSPSLSEESETIVESNITEISREFSRKLEKLVADENSSDITEMSHCTPSELNWPERERSENK